MRFLLSILALLLLAPAARAAEPQHSVARRWNEVLLDAIRGDFARPTVHARNLFHTSVAMYDAWAAYDATAKPFFLGRTVGTYTCPFDGVPSPEDVTAAREKAVSYAAFRLLGWRFEYSPGAATSLAAFRTLMIELGYDPDFTGTDYRSGDPAALGNYLAQNLIAFGRLDGSNEDFDYENRFYEPVNAPLIIKFPGNPTMSNCNRWQPLALDTFIDQSGQVRPTATPPFLGPEWGQVVSFCLRPEDLTITTRDGFDYWVYHDPGPPPMMDTLNTGGESEDYRWGHELVAIWSSQLDPRDGVMWDISPGGIGNLPRIPTTLEGQRSFYDLLGGGDKSPGRPLNPKTGQPYAPQIVPRGDYARVLAEFWADGPRSETPPGHWFTILNYVNDHPQSGKRYQGRGPVLDDLEWDVKAYFTLGATMHDVAVTVWGIKGRYDTSRPVSAIRFMAEHGQSSDPSLPSYHPAGFTLRPGYIELVAEGDSLAGSQNEHVGEVKLYAWRGPRDLTFPQVQQAGVGWILAREWWPYQRPTFVTPPFAGYISGHSTFSRAAAVVMTLLTGDEYFPGGLGEFPARRNEYLIHEEGPSVDVTLQWATYRDASDQCSLSRIWGGIHPTFDDIPGRHIGEELGHEVFAEARSYFTGGNPNLPPVPVTAIFPNPVLGSGPLHIALNEPTSRVEVNLFDAGGRLVREASDDVAPSEGAVAFDVGGLPSGVYFLRVVGDTWENAHQVLVLR